MIVYNSEQIELMDGGANGAETAINSAKKEIAAGST